MLQDNNMDQQQMEHQQQMEQQQMEQQMMQQQQMMGSTQQMPDNMTFDMKPNQTLFEKIIDESKSPIIVATLCILLCFKQVDTQVIKFIPKGLNANGEITTIGLLIKGLIAGLLFYITKKFI
jgi:hypothetical protein